MVRTVARVGAVGVAQASIQFRIALRTDLLMSLAIHFHILLGMRQQLAILIATGFTLRLCAAARFAASADASLHILTRSTAAAVVRAVARVGAVGVAQTGFQFRIALRTDLLMSLAIHFHILLGMRQQLAILIATGFTLRLCAAARFAASADASLHILTRSTAAAVVRAVARVGAVGVHCDCCRIITVGTTQDVTLGSLLYYAFHSMVVRLTISAATLFANSQLRTGCFATAAGLGVAGMIGIIDTNFRMRVITIGNPSVVMRGILLGDHSTRQPLLTGGALGAGSVAVSNTSRRHAISRNTFAMAKSSNDILCIHGVTILTLHSTHASFFTGCRSRDFNDIFLVPNMISASRDNTRLCVRGIILTSISKLAIRLTASRSSYLAIIPIMVNGINRFSIGMRRIILTGIGTHTFGLATRLRRHLTLVIVLQLIQLNMVDDISAVAALVLRIAIFFTSRSLVVRLVIMTPARNRFFPNIAADRTSVNLQAIGQTARFRHHRRGFRVSLSRNGIAAGDGHIADFTNNLIFDTGVCTVSRRTGDSHLGMAIFRNRFSLRILADVALIGHRTAIGTVRLILFIGIVAFAPGMLTRRRNDIIVEMTLVILADVMHDTSLAAGGRLGLGTYILMAQHRDRRSSYERTTFAHAVVLHLTVSLTSRRRLHDAGFLGGMAQRRYSLAVLGGATLTGVERVAIHGTGGGHNSASHKVVGSRGFDRPVAVLAGEGHTGVAAERSMGDGINLRTTSLHRTGVASTELRTFGHGVSLCGLLIDITGRTLQRIAMQIRRHQFAADGKLMLAAGFLHHITTVNTRFVRFAVIRTVTHMGCSVLVPGISIIVVVTVAAYIRISSIKVRRHCMGGDSFRIIGQPDRVDRNGHVSDGLRTIHISLSRLLRFSFGTNRQRNHTSAIAGDGGAIRGTVHGCRRIIVQLLNIDSTINHDLGVSAARHVIIGICTRSRREHDALIVRIIVRAAIGAPIRLCIHENITAHVADCTFIQNDRRTRVHFDILANIQHTTAVNSHGNVAIDWQSVIRSVQRLIRNGNLHFGDAQGRTVCINNQTATNILLCHIATANLEHSSSIITLASHERHGQVDVCLLHDNRSIGFHLGAGNNLQLYLNILHAVMRQREYAGLHIRRCSTTTEVFELEILINRGAVLCNHFAGAGNEAPCVQIRTAVHGDGASALHFHIADRAHRRTGATATARNRMVLSRQAHRTIDDNVRTLRHGQRTVICRGNIINGSR